MAIQGYWAAFFKAVSQAEKYNTLLNSEFADPLGTEWVRSTGVTRVFRSPFASGYSAELVGANQHLEQTISLERKIKGAIAVAGAVQINETAAAQSTAINDMTLLAALPAVEDAYYFGFELPTTQMRLNIGIAGVGTWTLAWEYWDGETWKALSNIVDGTIGYTVAGENNVAWTQPLAWETTVLQGITAYWVRARLSAFTAQTTQPLGTQAWWHPKDRILNTGAWCENLTASATLTLDQLNSGGVSLITKTYAIPVSDWKYCGTYDTIHADCTQVKLRFSSVADTTFYVALTRLLSLLQTGGAHGLEASTEFEVTPTTSFADTNTGKPWPVFRLGLETMSATVSSYYKTHDGQFSQYLSNDEPLYFMFFRHYGAQRDRIEAWGKISDLATSFEPAVVRRNLTIQLEKDWVEINE